MFDPLHRFLTRTRGLRRGAIAGLALLALGMALAACSSPETSEEPQPTHVAQSGGTFHFAQASPRTLDPARLESVYESTVVNQIFDGLVAFDANLNTVPALAESWTISRDGTEYTFRIQRGVLFHNQTELTADDVAYSLTRIYRLPTEQTDLAREYLSHIEGTREFADGKSESISGIELISPYELKITLRHPFASFLAVLAMDCARVVPREYIERVGDEVFARAPVGTGPFVLREWEQDRSIVLTAFEDYHFGRAHLDSLIFETPKESRRDYATDAFLRGRLDMLEVIPGQVSELKRRAGVVLTSRQELSLTFLALNFERPPFDNPYVRRALAQAVDRHALFADNDPARKVPFGILPPGMPGYTRESRLLPYDPEYAKQLLASGGYPNGEGLPTISLVTSDQSAQATVFYAKLAAQLAEVGFRVHNEHLSWLDFYERLKSGDGNCFTLNWVADIPDPDSFLYPLFHSHGATNYVHYANPSVDEMLAGGRRARSSLDRLDIYREAEQLIIEDAPMVPLFHTVIVLATRPEVRGLDLTPMGMGNIAFENVWFERLQVASGERP